MYAKAKFVLNRDRTSAVAYMPDGRLIGIHSDKGKVEDLILELHVPIRDIPITMEIYNRSLEETSIINNLGDNMLDYKGILEELGIKNVFTQNSKMKKSSQNGINLYNFGIPAFRSKTGLTTCPKAKSCVAGCYARSGTYLFSNVAKVYEAKLQLTLHPQFRTIIIGEVDKLIKKAKGNKVLIRVHDSGDFYNEAYQGLWYTIAYHYENNPQVQFYAYTKSVSQSKKLEPNRPNNFRLIYSLGGHEDDLINYKTDYHAKVFENNGQLELMDYVDATNDDTIAALGDSIRIGLVYHGTKNYNNTTWDRVK